MNKLFLKIATLTAGVTMAIGVGVGLSSHKDAKSVSAATSYQKATSIAANDTVVLVYETGKLELGSISTTSTKYGIGTAYTTLPNGAYPLTVEAGSSSGTFSFKNGSNYLNWSSGNSLSTSTTKSANTSWNVNFSGSNVSITNAATSGDTTRYLKYNTSNPRFACYQNDSQSAIALYKLVESPEGAVTGVSLDKSFEVIKSSGSLTLTETIAPDNATNKNVSWSSSDESVATVADGVVTPLAKGHTTITVTTQDGGFTAECVVVVADHLGTAADPLSTSDAALVQAGSTGTTDSKYYVRGDVTQMTISVSDGWANGKMTDGDTEINIYKTYDEGTSSSSKFTDAGKIIVTDTIVIHSVITMYGSKVQLQYGNLYSVVRNVTLTSVEIRNNVTNAQYVGEDWDVSELQVVAIYSNDDEVDVTDQVTLVCNPTKPTASGPQSFTVNATFSEVAAEEKVFNVNVLTPVPTSSDVIDSSDLVATTTQYKDFSGVTKTSKAVYAGNSAKNANSAIQLRSNNNNSGIISTKSGGKRIKSVSITVESSSPSIQVYGSNVAYSGTDASALYNDSTKGTLVDTLTTSKTSVNFQDDYKYVGIRSASGSAYLVNVTIVWELYTAEEIAANIKTMAGGWDNIAETENCGSNYASAKGMILTLSDDELNTFQTSNDTEIKSARETYETWCDRNGDVNPYNGSIVSNSQIAAQSSSVDSSALVLVIVIIASASLCSVSLLLVFKRKRNK